MSPIEFILVETPTVALGIIIVAGAVALSIGGLLLARRVLRIEKLKISHEISGNLFHTLGVIYAVVLAFMVIVAWENFDRIDSNVSMEANCYADLSRDANALSEPFRSQAKEAIGVYVEAVVEEEWPMLAWGGRSANTHELFTEIWDIYLSYEPETKSEDIFFTASVEKLNEAGELRTQRIMDSRSHLHPILWSVLLVGGAITIIFSYFLVAEKLRTQIVMTALFSSIIALILFTILVLDFPFASHMGIKPDAFRPILMYLGSG